MQKWYRINIEYLDGYSSSSPASKEKNKAISLFESKALEYKEELSKGLIDKMNLTEYIITNGGTSANVTNVIKWKKLNKNKRTDQND